MELSEKYKIELINLQKAVSSFEAGLHASFENLDSIGNDLIKLLEEVGVTGTHYNEHKETTVSKTKTNIMSFTEKLQREKLQSLKGQLNYTNECLVRQNEMQSWEVKEYNNLKSSYEQEILELENHIKNVF